MHARPISADGHRGSRERTRNSRLITSCTLAVLALLVAIVATIDLERARDAQAKELTALAQASQELAAMRDAFRRARDAASLMHDARLQGMSVGQWSSRAIDVEQAQTSRVAFNALLEQTRRAPDRFFEADSFDVAVPAAGEGLFQPPLSPEKALMLTLKGNLHFRAGVQP